MCRPSLYLDSRIRHSLCVEREGGGTRNQKINYISLLHVYVCILPIYYVSSHHPDDDSKTNDLVHGCVGVFPRIIPFIFSE